MAMRCVLLHLVIEATLRKHNYNSNFQKLTIQGDECRLSALPANVNIINAGRRDTQRTDYTGSQVNFFSQMLGHLAANCQKLLNQVQF